MSDITGIQKPFLARISEYSDIVLAITVVAILGILVLPLPPMLLDFLLAFNITLSIVILLVTMYLTRPLDFSVFPSMLLIITLFRLALNVASTRLILGQAYAGEVISSFGNFVVGGNYVVGFIIFAILVIIQFVVITKGAGRIAEVAARFTLDAMPGKQMAIDADLNAGLISENDARKRLRRYGWRFQICPRRRHCQYSYYSYKCHWWHLDRRSPKGNAGHRSFNSIYSAYYRRWPCHSDSSPDYIDFRRYCCDSRGV
jgi:hypothetical protein